MKKKFLITILSLVCVLGCAFALAACGGSGEQGGSQGGQHGVSYGTATVNYHYEYNVVLEHYMQEKYSVQIGMEYELSELYTPPMKAGYRFLGWTMEQGGVGDIVGTPFIIVGAGFGGTVYDLYAKYEEINFNVVYHLDGGTNHADNPTSLTGKQTLKNPTKEKHNFLGWYLDPEFNGYTTSVFMTDDQTTTIDLYAKLQRVYEINYVSDQPNVMVKGDQSYYHYTRYTEDDSELHITLEPEYFENYLFLGWEIEESGELVECAEITVNPKEEKRDITYTAHYLVASNPRNTPGLKTLVSYGKHNFYAGEEVTRIVVEDMYGSKEHEKTFDVTVYYSSEEPPEVLIRDGVKLTLIYDPEAVKNAW